MNEKVNILQDAALELVYGTKEKSFKILKEEYPFKPYRVFHRSYTLSQKKEQFMRDGFIDRYTGERLVNPGILKVFSDYFSDIFPYHPHSKMTEGHIAYWEVFPTIDHIIPIAMGGIDEESNWATTSMLNNSVKSNWTLEQVHWKLHPAGNIHEWSGLTELFVKIVESDKELLKDKYVKDWYRVSISI